MLRFHLVNIKANVFTGHLACVKLLLQEGADIEQRNVVSCATLTLYADLSTSQPWFDGDSTFARAQASS